LTAHPDDKYPNNIDEDEPLEIVVEKGFLGTSLPPVELGKKETHGTKSKHSVGIEFSNPPFEQNVTWTLKPTAKIQPICNPAVEKCSEVSASTTALFSYGGKQQGLRTETVKLTKAGFVIPQPQPKKDPVITLYLDEQAFFSADIFATIPLVPGLEPTLHAEFSFGTLAPGYDLTLFYEGLSCGLATCSSDTSFLNSLQSIVSTGPGGNWSFDPVLKVFTPNNDIGLPDFIYTNSISKEGNGTFGASTQGSDPDVERVPGPLTILGIGAAFGFSRKLRKRIKNSESLQLAGAID
jgi:hypothetical protein